MSGTSDASAARLFGELLTAINDGNVARACRAIAAGACVNGRTLQFHRSPLHLSVARLDLRMTQTLLAAGAAPSARIDARGGGFSALHSAAASGRLDLVDALLEHGADVNAEASVAEAPDAPAETSPSDARASSQKKRREDKSRQIERC